MAATAATIPVAAEAKLVLGHFSLEVGEHVTQFALAFWTGPGGGQREILVESRWTALAWVKLAWRLWRCRE